MNVIFRVDAALHIGSGHVMRCLTLADELTLHDVKCIFICRSFQGNLFTMIKEKGYQLFSLPAIDTIPAPKPDQIVPHEHWLACEYEKDAAQTIEVLIKLNIYIDWLIVDHYAIDIRWESLLRPLVSKIMLIDDLADRRHDCDLLLDQTYGRNESDYQTLNNGKARYLLGAKYALLRNEFLAHREKSLSYYDNELLTDPIKRIFISMGGIDKDNCTGAIIDCISHIFLSASDELHIVMGKNAVWLKEVELKVKRLKSKTFIYHNVQNIAEIMSHCNLAIGAGGTTTWERSVLGMPSIVISMADNQDLIIQTLAEYGAHWYVGKYPLIRKSSLLSSIAHAISDHYALKNLSKRSRRLCDGKGTVRVVKMLQQDQIIFSPVTIQEIDLLYQWRNHPAVRAASLNSDEISYKNHVKWIKEKLCDDNVKLLLAMTKSGKQVGCVRLELDNEIAEISIYLNPEQFSSGYGKLILKDVLFWIKTNCPKIQGIKAQIKESNKISQSLFKSAGYIRTVSNYFLKV